MFSRLLFAAALPPAALAVAPTPALAHAPAGHLAGDPVPAGCVRAHVHVPAGKIAHAPAPIRCAGRARVAQVEAAASHPRAPLTAPRLARD